jgi:hypothetical protein
MAQKGIITDRNGLPLAVTAANDSKVALRLGVGRPRKRPLKEIKATILKSLEMSESI